jgi:glycosyltransferase involved in cell wall biosynthesis
MIAVSQAVADNFVGPFSPLKRRVTTILNAIDLERFQPDPNARQLLRREFALAENELAIGIVGQLTPRKGQLELIGAFAKALHELPEARLLIVGAAVFNRDEEYAELLQQRIHELGIENRVCMTGNRADVASVLQALDLVVVNSSVEPFGLVALEAMACGAPVLAAVSGGIPELIKHGQNGWLVPQGDEQRLTAALVELGGRPELRRQLAEQGKTHMAATFSADRLLVQLHDFYDSFSDSRLAPNESAATAHTEAAKFA